MSGGHYDYKYNRLHDLADSIEGDFLNGGDYITEDYSVERDRYTGKFPMKTANLIGDADKKQRKIILKEINKLISDLRNCASRARELEWYMSGDTGATSYLERLKEKGIIK